MPYTLRSREVPDVEAQPPRKRFRREVKVNSSRIPQINIADIPEEVVIMILGYLSRSDLLLNAALVSTQWRRLTEAPQLWRRIDLSNLQNVSPELVENLLKKSKTIIYINLYDCTFKENSSSIIREICNQKRLQTLILGRFYPIEFATEQAENNWKSTMSWLNDQSLKMIGESCTNLIELDVGGCQEVSPVGLETIIKRCRNLKHLNLNGLNEHLDDFLNALVAHSSKIEILHIVDCDISKNGKDNLRKAVETKVCGFVKSQRISSAIGSIKRQDLGKLDTRGIAKANLNKMRHYKHFKISTHHTNNKKTGFQSNKESISNSVFSNAKH